MRLFIAAAIILMYTESCNDMAVSETLMTPDNLALKRYTINVDRDTTLQTEKGALLKIPAKAFKLDKGNSVTLLIREAYSLNDMVNAGLLTQSDDKPLSSGGMIYIGTAEEQNVSFTQPVKVAIPAKYLQKGMQLYRGEESNGKIMWTKPTPLLQNKQITSIDTGKTLFESNCANCHAIGKDLTGPDLAHFPKRFPPDEGNARYWYHDFRVFYEPHLINEMTLKSDSLYVDHWSDPYACNLINRYGTFDPTFSYTWPQLKAIYNYIQNESDRLNLPYPAHDYLRTCADSCKFYKATLRDLQFEKHLLRQRQQALTQENGALVKVEPDTTWQRNIDTETVDVARPIDFEEKVSPNYYDAVYYQFSVESFGWLNVDMMLDQVPGVQESELFAKVSGDYKEKIKTFLIIPSAKTYAEGGPIEGNSETFAYYLKTGKIPLPQNVDAYILALTETDSSLAYGFKKFTTSRQQSIEISLHSASRQEFSSAMQEFDNDRLHIKVAATKNFNELRNIGKTVKEINQQLNKAEQLKPKRCDCDCAKLSVESAMPVVKDAAPAQHSSNVSPNLSVIVFPNPSPNEFTIRTKSNDQKHKVTLMVINAAGNLVDSKNNVDPNSANVMGANYKPGIYFAQVIQGSERQVVKMIKQ
jgi:hypothetical protein